MSLVYDRAGRPVTITDGSGTRALVYDPVSGQLQNEDYTAGLLANLGVHRTFNPLQRLGSLSASSASSALNQMAFGYDAASRLENVTSGVNSATYGYVPNSPLVQTVTFAQGGATRLTTTKSYDNLNRLSSISSVPSASSAVSGVYSYNAANQRTQLTREDNAYWDFGYDALGQVTTAKKSLDTGVAVLGHDFAWTFDDIGNRKTSTSNSRLSTFSANALNQYTQRTVPGAFDLLAAANAAATVTYQYPADTGTPTALPRTGELLYAQLTADNSGGNFAANVKVTGVKNNVGPNGEDAVTEITRGVFLPKTPEAFSYDADGNLTDDARWHYTWDGENRLIAMETQATAVTAGLAKRKLEFAYDGQGRRISKKTYGWNGAAWVLDASLLFLYDGWNLLAELNALNSNAAVRTYAWGLDLSGSTQGAGGVGGLLFANLGSATHAPAFDGNGNVIAYVDLATGAKSATYEYGAFGETLVADGPVAELFPFRFSTKYQDSGTDLYYYGLRYCSPHLGRWLSRDPIEEDGGVNLYAFVENDTVSLVDAIGEAPVIDPRLPGGYRDPVTGRATRNPNAGATKKGKNMLKALEFLHGQLAKEARREFIQKGRSKCEELAKAGKVCAKCCVIDIYSVDSGPKLESKVYYYSGAMLLSIPCDEARKRADRIGAIREVRPDLARDETEYIDWSK